jgi:FkbM family methyltransferase
MKISKFLSEYLDEIIKNSHNFYNDNFDIYRFGINPMKDKSKQTGKFKFVKNFLRKLGYVRSKEYRQDIKKALALIETNEDRCSNLYDLLSNEESKKELVKVLTYRALRHRKVKFPLNNAEYWNGIKEVEKHSSYTDAIEIQFQDWKLPKINLTSLNIPCKLFTTPKSGYTQFVYQHYRCKTEKGNIEVEPGDYVLDAGACWGDTALYFANLAGSSGKVFSFEFVKENIGIFNQNKEINPELSPGIQIIEYALWDKSDEIMYFDEMGPGTSLNMRESTNKLEVKTISIDDWMKKNNIQKIDFIKMDIEGAEINALLGAKETLKKYKPKLAISIYHRLSDFYEIIEFLNSLELDYKFFLKHASIHKEETVLFATTKN